MSQVNVNTPGEPAPRSDGTGYGMVVGILVAIVVIALVLWLLVFNNGDTDNGGTDGTDTEESIMPDASGGWRIIDAA